VGDWGPKDRIGNHLTSKDVSKENPCTTNGIGNKVGCPQKGESKGMKENTVYLTGKTVKTLGEPIKRGPE